MQRAQRGIKKEQPHAALLWSRGYKNHLELLRYTAPVGLIPHGPTWVYGRGVSHPRMQAAPVSSLLSQGRWHRSLARAVETKRCSPYCLSVFREHGSEDQDAPPRGDPTYKKIIIEDGVGDVILSSATVRTESNIMWPKGGCRSKYCQVKSSS